MPEMAGKRSERQRGNATASAAGSAEVAPRQAAPMGAGQLMIDLDFLRGLIAAVDQSGIDSLEIHRAGTRIRIAKTPDRKSVV